MSRRSSRGGGGGGRDEREFVLECRASYLTVFSNIKDDIDNQDDLLTALQQSGRNPTSKAMKKYWLPDTDTLSFDDFVDVCRKEPVTTSDDLMKAFRKIDLNGDGFLSLDELFKIMTTRGEKMSREEVRKMIDDVDENKDGRLDYSEFCNMVMKTSKESQKLALKNMERRESKLKGGADRDADRDRDHRRDGSQLSLQSSASQRSHHRMMGSQTSLKSNGTLTGQSAW